MKTYENGWRQAANYGKIRMIKCWQAMCTKNFWTCTLHEEHDSTECACSVYVLMYIHIFINWWNEFSQQIGEDLCVSCSWFPVSSLAWTRLVWVWDFQVRLQTQQTYCLEAHVQFRFDDDQSGTIEYDEFLRHIFPEEYVKAVWPCRLVAGVPAYRCPGDPAIPAWPSLQVRRSMLAQSTFLLHFRWCSLSLKLMPLTNFRFDLVSLRQADRFWCI